MPLLIAPGFSIGPKRQGNDMGHAFEKTLPHLYVRISISGVKTEKGENITGGAAFLPLVLMDPVAKSYSLMARGWFGLKLNTASIYFYHVLKGVDNSSSLTS